MAASNTDKLIKGAAIWQGTIGVAGVLDDIETTIVLSDAAGLPTDTAVELTIDRTDNVGNLTPDKKEVIRGVVSVNDIIDCVRGVEGTAQAHSPSALVECRLTADQWERLIDHLLIEHNQDGTHKSTILDSGLITAAPSTDHSASGLKIQMVATATTNFGDVCYIASTGKMTLIDADAIASMSGIFMCADAQIAADATGNWLALGIARDDTWSWTVGGLIYGTVTGTTGNTLSQTAPTGTDDVVQILGVATHADRMFFNPQLVQIEHT